MSDLYVQYGCGWSAPSGWLNFDVSPTLRFERIPVVGQLYTRNGRRFPENVRYGDIVKGLPIEEQSCKGIFCSHVLEHLALDDFDVALSRTYGYLRSGGVFRLVVPDLEQLARTYLADGDPMAASHFMEASYLGTKSRARSFSMVFLSWLGNSKHLWMWDEKSMARKLEEHGFTCIHRASYGDSSDRRFDEVEDEGRFIGCLGMECAKR